MANQVKVVNALSVFNKVKDILETQENLAEINSLIYKYDSNGSFRGVIVGNYKMIGQYPCAVVIPGDITISPVATAHTYETIINFEVGVYTKNIMMHEAFKMHWELAQLIWEILCSPQYETLEITDTDGTHRLYLFEAFSGLRHGTVEGGAIRASLIICKAYERKNVL